MATGLAIVMIDLAMLALYNSFCLLARILEVIPRLGGLLSDTLTVCFYAASHAGQLNRIVIADASAVHDSDDLLQGMATTWHRLARKHVVPAWGVNALTGTDIVTALLSDSSCWLRRESVPYWLSASVRLLG